MPDMPEETRIQEEIRREPTSAVVNDMMQETQSPLQGGQSACGAEAALD